MADDLLDKVGRLKVVMTDRATGGRSPDAAFEYWNLRKELYAIPAVKPLLPESVRLSHTIDEFWTYIKSKFDHYQERRDCLQQQFAPLMCKIEDGWIDPSDSMIDTTVAKLDSAYVKALWEKAIQRRKHDPAGAITAARSLLEAVSKHILEEKSVVYDNAEALPTLYKRAAGSLDLSPSTQTEQEMKQLLGGCESIVNGLASLRNKAGDAHGSGKNGHAVD